MSGNFAIKGGGGGGGGRLMANAILNFHFDYLKPSLMLYLFPNRVYLLKPRVLNTHTCTNPIFVRNLHDNHQISHIEFNYICGAMIKQQFQEIKHLVTL